MQHNSFFWSKKPTTMEYQVTGSRMSLSQATSGFTYKNHKLPVGATLIYKGEVVDRKNKEDLVVWKEKHIEGFLSPRLSGAVKAGWLTPVDAKAKRVASRYLQRRSLLP